MEVRFNESSCDLFDRITVLDLDMGRVIGLCLASSLTSLGGCNDENTEWAKKISDVEDDTVEAALVGLCHDMAECVIGDITPHDNVTEEDKAEREDKAFRDLVKELPGHMVPNEQTFLICSKNMIGSLISVCQYILDWN